MPCWRAKDHETVAARPSLLVQATSTPNQGRFNQLAAEVVNKHGIIYVASAGNGTPLGRPSSHSGSSIARPFHHEAQCYCHVLAHDAVDDCRYDGITYWAADFTQHNAICCALTTHPLPSMCISEMCIEV